MQMAARACRWFSQRYGALFQVVQVDPTFSPARKLQTVDNIVSCWKSTFMTLQSTPMSDFIVVPLASPLHRCVRVPVGMDLDIAPPFHQILDTPVSRWDQEKLAGLVRGQGRARSLEDVQRELEILVLDSNLSQPHLTAEEYWHQLSGAVRPAAQSSLQVTRTRLERPEDTAATLQSVLEARKAVVHSPADLVALIGIRRAGFSAQCLPALISLLFRLPRTRGISLKCAG